MGEQTLSSYLSGLNKLIMLLGKDHAKYYDVLEFQAQLRENIEDALKGDTSDLGRKRSHIIHQLNRISNESLDIPFNQLCFPEERMEIITTMKTELQPDSLPDPAIKFHEHTPLEKQNPFGIIELITGLENELTHSNQIYPDQCDIYIRQIDEIDPLNSEHHFSFPSGYEDQTSTSYLTAKLNSLKDLLIDFKNASPLRWAKIRQDITKLIAEIKDTFE